MGDRSKIEWTDATFNPWIGCTEVSTTASGGGGCDGCYAREMAQRYGWAKWGVGKPRHRTSIQTWKKVHGWNRKSAMENRRMRVFCASLADVFDNEIPARWRADLWALIRATPALDWLIVTKRIGNAGKMFPADWGAGYPNVTLLITVVNQAEADRDIPKLLATRAARRGLSVEPMLGPIDLESADHGENCLDRECWGECAACDKGMTPARNCQREPDEAKHVAGIDWVICGGETDQGSHRARAIHPDWARALRDQCAAADVPFHLKQWGEWLHQDDRRCMEFSARELHTWPGPEEEVSRKIGAKNAGRLLDGVEHNGFPVATL